MRNAIRFFGTFRRGSRGGSRLSRIFVRERRALQRTALFYVYSDSRCPSLRHGLAPEAAATATTAAVGSATSAGPSQSQHRSFWRCDADAAVCVHRDRL